MVRVHCFQPELCRYLSMQEKSSAFPLAIAAQNGRTQTVERLLQEKAININQENGVRSASPCLYSLHCVLLVG